MTKRFTRLDRASIRQLKVGEKSTEHGITAERLYDGDVRYTVAFMVDGQRIHRTIGRDSEGVTRSQAEEFIEAKRAEAREGRLSLPGAARPSEFRGRGRRLPGQARGRRGVRMLRRSGPRSRNT